MLASAKTPKKKIIIYSIIITAMLAGNAYIYYINSDQSRITPIDEFFMTEDLDQELIESTTQQANLSQSVLEHNVFITLEKIGDWPITPTNIGKADPFAPFVIKESLEDLWKNQTN